MVAFKSPLSGFPPLHNTALIKAPKVYLTTGDDSVAHKTVGMFTDI